MECLNKNLSVLSYANGFTLWHYTTTDTIEQVTNNNYFSKVATLMHVGDIIIINSNKDTYIKCIVDTNHGVKFDNLK